MMELAHWQQRDADILPILITIKSKSKFSAVEIDKTVGHVEVSTRGH